MIFKCPEEEGQKMVSINRSLLKKNFWKKTHFYITTFMQTMNWIDSENDVIWGNKVIKYVWCQQSKHGSWCISTKSWSCLERESNIVWGWKSIKLQHHQQHRLHVSDFTIFPLCLQYRLSSTLMKFQTNKAVMTRNNKLNITITAHWSASTDFAKRVKVHKKGLSLRICQPCSKTLHVNWGKFSIP